MAADTIFAPATARGRAGVAVIRLSGPLSHDVVQRLCGDVPPERMASVRRVRDGDEILDEALVVVFGEGRSFTGEKVAEFHLHGSPAVVAAVLRVLGRIQGLRPADPGEFTRRAMEHGRLDLSQVEGLADLLAAETEIQRRQAQRILSGAIGQRVERWRRDLLRAVALLEVTIDFVEENVPTEVFGEVRALLMSVRQDFETQAAGALVAERIRDGFEVAIVGPPNIGKSTLLNRLAGREAAITSAVAGTTRDVIEVKLDIGGMAITVLDTAGLRESSDSVEQMGVDRALARASTADLRIFLLPEGDAPPSTLFVEGDIVVIGKADTLSGDMLAVSGLSGLGVDRLISTVVDTLSERVSGAGALTRARHAAAVGRASEALGRAEALCTVSGGVELIADEIHSALNAVDALVGRVDVDQVLDVVFSSFCIGK